MYWRDHKRSMIYRACFLVRVALFDIESIPQSSDLVPTLIYFSFQTTSPAINSFSNHLQSNLKSPDNIKIFNRFYIHIYPYWKTVFYCLQPILFLWDFSYIFLLQHWPSTCFTTFHWTNACVDSAFRNLHCFVPMPGHVFKMSQILQIWNSACWEIDSTSANKCHLSS